MSGWWLLAPLVLALGTGVVAVTGRRLQREAAGVRSSAAELAELGADGAVLRQEADALAAHLARTRQAAATLGDAAGDR